MKNSLQLTALLCVVLLLAPMFPLPAVAADVPACRVGSNPVAPEKDVDWGSECIVMLKEPRAIQTYQRGGKPGRTCTLGLADILVVDKTTGKLKRVLGCNNPPTPEYAAWIPEGKKICQNQPSPVPPGTPAAHMPKIPTAYSITHLGEVRVINEVDFKNSLQVELGPTTLRAIDSLAETYRKGHEKRGLSTGAKAGIGAGLAALVGGIVYAATRGKGSNTTNIYNQNPPGGTPPRPPGNN